MIWGTNPNHTSGGIRRQTVIKIVESGAKIVVIDPRKIDLAGLADLWIKPRPGTDGALAMGLLKVVVEEGLYDKEFVRDWTVGFDELKSRAGQPSRWPTWQQPPGCRRSRSSSSPG